MRATFPLFALLTFGLAAVSTPAHARIVYALSHTYDAASAGGRFGSSCAFLGDMTAALSNRGGLERIFPQE